MAKASYKKCVTSMCKNCIYDPVQKGTWREQVENCTATHCPLFPVRPVTTATKRQNREEQKQEAEA